MSDATKDPAPAGTDSNAIPGDRGLSPAAKVTNPMWHRAIVLLVVTGVIGWFTWQAMRPKQVETAKETPAADSASQAGKMPGNFAKAGTPSPPGAQNAANKPLTPAPTTPPPVGSNDAESMSMRAPVMAKLTRSVPAQAVSPASAGPSEPARGIGAAMVTSDIHEVTAEYAGDPTYRLSAGTVIPCVLDTAIDTTVMGFAECHLDRDVYSDSGGMIVFEAGTRVFGEYSASLKPGQERIGVIWSRALTPRSVKVRFDSPASDPVGRAGMDGAVETYFWTRFGAAMLLSLIQDANTIGRAYLTNQATNGNPGAVNYGTNTIAAGQQVAATALNSTINIPPVLLKNPGERVTIFLRNDLDFSKVYRLQH